jgi:hypothetical protein
MLHRDPSMASKLSAMRIMLRNPDNLEFYRNGVKKYLAEYRRRNPAFLLKLS